MNTRAKLFTVSALLLTMMCAAFAFASERAPRPTPAPHFKVKDLTGRTLDLTKLTRRGPVLIDFWATWCKPCVEALPELQSLHHDYAERGLTVIGVSVDGPRNFAKVRPFAASMGLEYPIVLDTDGRLQQLYHVLAVPTAFLIDTTRTIVQVRVAYRPGEGAKLEDSIRALLPAPTAP